MFTLFRMKTKEKTMRYFYWVHSTYCQCFQIRISPQDHFFVIRNVFSSQLRRVIITVCLHYLSIWIWYKFEFSHFNFDDLIPKQLNFFVEPCCHLWVSKGISYDLALILNVKKRFPQISRKPTFGQKVLFDFDPHFHCPRNIEVLLI